MLRSVSPLVQALLGGLLTWLLTAIGAAAVFANCSPQNTLIMDVSLGFAAGVMTAASFWSLLQPALAQVELSIGIWGCVPVALGFIAGGGFVFVCDLLLKWLGLPHGNIAELLAKSKSSTPTRQTTRLSELDAEDNSLRTAEPMTTLAVAAELQLEPATTTITIGDDKVNSDDGDSDNDDDDPPNEDQYEKNQQKWRRIMLLILAIVIHNIPEGAAVGIAFASAAHPEAAGPTFNSAVTLALGMGIQNLPEGMAVSLPLISLNYTRCKAFFYGQLSGAVEPVAAVLGALAVSYLTVVQPYALAFAAGAMIYVVYEDLIPAGHEHQNGKWTTASALCGFSVMMVLDVMLG